jgi:hypothetical protein
LTTVSILAAGVLVADVDSHINAAGDDPGSEDAGRLLDDILGEHGVAG